MLDNILAKKNPVETLSEHTDSVISVWEEIQEKYISDIDDITDELFWKDSFISVLFHDFGKVSENFQNMIKNNNFENNLRHEMLSGLLLLFSNQKYYLKHPLSLFAVFSHHKLLDDFLFVDDLNKTLVLKQEKILSFSEYFRKKIINNKLSFTIPDEIINELHSINQKNLYSVFKDHFYDKILRDNSFESRKKYILHKSILTLSDWLGSGHHKLIPNLIYNNEYLSEKIIKKIIEENKKFQPKSFSFRKFQGDSLIKNDVIAIAPTGSGKTEAALLWASLKNNNSKILYLLPTRVTSNAIFKRLSKYFGEENVALVHSSAKFVREDLNENYDTKNYLLEKVFYKNLSVATVDQLLTLGFNLGYWELKTFHLLNARIIIDEIHLYAPYTLGLIIATIKHLKSEFNSQFYIMSATMPKKLKELLNKTLESQIIQDKELLNESRNIFEIRESLIDDIDDEIINSLKNFKKVLIVVNTVDEAIRIYRKYKEYEKNVDNVVCYHSRFTQFDKIEKEEIITQIDDNSSILLVATQVVEVSLDIDFDILFTENAPIDAIIQRAGRINRKRKKNNTKVVVFKHEEVTEKYVYSENKILENTFNILKENNNKRLTEKQLNQLVNEVYKNIDIENTESYKDGLNKYSEIQKSLSYIKDNRSSKEVFTREGLDSISVIPFMFYENLTSKTIKEKSKYEISIRRSRYFTAKREKDDDGFKYVDYKYDNEIGLTFEKGSPISESL